MSIADSTIVSALHLGGVDTVVELDRDTDEVDLAIAQLRRCHDHVFVVDQSGGHIRLGVSARGAHCIVSALGIDHRRVTST